MEVMDCNIISSFYCIAVLKYGYKYLGAVLVSLFVIGEEKYNSKNRDSFSCATMLPHMNKILLVVLLLIPVNAFAVSEIPRTAVMNQAMFDDMSANMACLCGCGTTIKTCPHPSCSFAIPLRKELKALIASNLSSAEVIAKLVSSRGEAVLAKPTFTGFNIMAWVTPFIVMAIVGFGIFVMIRNWSAGKSKNGDKQEPAKKTVDEDDPYLKKMREELGSFDE